MDNDQVVVEGEGLFEAAEQPITTLRCADGRVYKMGELARNGRVSRISASATLPGWIEVWVEGDCLEARVNALTSCTEVLYGRKSEAE
jgi:hypothetical protein